MGLEAVEDIGIEHSPVSSSEGSEQVTEQSQQLLKRTEPDIQLKSNQLKEYELKIQALTKKCEQLKQEFRNYRARGIQKDSQNEKLSREKLIKELLSGLDALDRAKEFTVEKRLPKRCSKILADIKSNLEMTYDKIISILNLLVINPSPGEKFESARHIALKKVNSERYHNNIIVSVVRKGYMLNNTVLRPAEVMISKYISKRRRKLTLFQRFLSYFRS